MISMCNHGTTIIIFKVGLDRLVYKTEGNYVGIREEVPPTQYILVRTDIILDHRYLSRHYVILFMPIWILFILRDR